MELFEALLAHLVQTSSLLLELEKQVLGLVLDIARAGEVGAGHDEEDLAERAIDIWLLVRQQEQDTKHDLRDQLLCCPLGLPCGLLGRFPC